MRTSPWWVRVRSLLLKPDVPEVNASTLAHVVYLAASTLDLRLVDPSTLGKQNKKHLWHLQREVSEVQEALRKAKL